MLKPWGIGGRNISWEGVKDLENLTPEHFELEGCLESLTEDFEDRCYQTVNIAQLQCNQSADVLSYEEHSKRVMETCASYLKGFPRIIEKFPHIIRAEHPFLKQANTLLAFHTEYWEKKKKLLPDGLSKRYPHPQ